MAVSAVSKANREELFPWWVVRKIGQPILLEADWLTIWGSKWGALVQGTGTGFELARDNEHSYGGSASARMRSGDVTDDVIEIKTQYATRSEGHIAFEHKFLTDNSPTTNRWDFGIEFRTDSIIQARCRFDVSTNEWRYEVSTDVYASFNPPVIVPRPGRTSPTGLTTGTTWGWARIVADTQTKQYVRFEAAGQNGIEIRNMTGIQMVDRATTGAGYLQLYFVLGYTGAGGSREIYHTTDWCVAVLS